MLDFTEDDEDDDDDDDAVVGVVEGTRTAFFMAANWVFWGLGEMLSFLFDTVIQRLKRGRRLGF